MNNNQKALKLQENIISKKVKKYNEDYWLDLIYKNNLNSILNNQTNKYRNRIYTQEKTLSMFLTQAINQDSSCQKIVSSRSLIEKTCSTSTGAYCKARQRLNTSSIKNMCTNLALKNQNKVHNKWKFRGRDVYLIDGTTITMPDTTNNQNKYPQMNGQKVGLGFPICRVVSIISLETACVIDTAISPYSGKGAAEQTLLRGMLDNFKKGDILLADAIYSTYALLSYVIEKGIDIVFVQNGARSRKTDFNKGKYLGKKDHLITIKKPKEKPEWMDITLFKNKPKSLTIRELKVAGKILITTMLCDKTFKAKTIRSLYKNRWQIEVDFRNIKNTLGLKSFSCKTPDMVIKELWVYLLAYNLIRTMILDSAIYNNIYPREISFKHTIQLIENYMFLNSNINLYYKLLVLIANKTIGNREGRIEPRAIKKRHNNYPLLMKPRKIAQQLIKENGHP